MIIKSADIEGFGRFAQRSIELRRGFNLIYGGNEDGKTTFMTFIKMMFYSSSGKTEKGQDLLKIPRKKYRPWNGAPMAGAVEFDAGGKLYRLHKEFLKSEATDKTSVFCKTSGEDEKIANPNEAGKHFFGMDLGEFERSVFIGASGGFSSDAAADSLAMRISNLSVSGDENTSHELVVKRLEDAAFELVSKSGKKGLLVDADAKLSELRLEKQRILQQSVSQKALFEEIAQLEAEIAKDEERLKAISASQKAASVKKELNAFYTLSNKINLRENINKQLAKYGKSGDELKKHIADAKKLEGEIADTVSKIEELSAASEIKRVSDDEYSRAAVFDKAAAASRADLELLRGKVFKARAAYDDAAAKAVKSARAFALAMSCIATVFAVLTAFAGIKAQLPLLFLGGALLFCVGAAAFVFLPKVLVKRSTEKPAVLFAKRDFEAELHKISAFTEDMPNMELAEIENILNLQLSDAVSGLDGFLTRYGCLSLEELKKMTAAYDAGELAAVSARLNMQKEEFTLHLAELKSVDGYVGAKILFNEITDSFSTLKSITADIETIGAAAGISDVSEDNVTKKIKELADFLQRTSAIEATDEDGSEIEADLRELRSRLGECQSRIYTPEKSESEIAQLICEAEARRDELKKRLDELSAASEVMAEAVAETNNGLGLHLSQKTGEYLAALTDGKYSDVLVSRSFDVETRCGDGEAFHEWKYLSSGAVDKVYLALRLAATDILTKDGEALPLFLDDIFAQYDDKSCKRALEFLKEYLETKGSASQILFFTCHRYIADMAKNVFADANEVLL